MAARNLEDLKGYAGEDQIISSHEMEVKLESEHHQLLSLKSRIPSLDKATQGFEGGELVTISGPTKGGKTLLAQTLTKAFVAQQEYPLWFSFEVPPHQFLSQFRELPLFYLPAKLKVHVLPWVEERIMEGFLKYRTRVVFIDHLHFLFDMGKVRNPSLEIGTLVRRLKTIAVDNNFIIFLIAHTTKGKNEPNLSYESIRDSSFISQESDVVLIICRTPDRGENTAKLSIEFSRRTGVFECMVNLRKIDGYLMEEIEREEPKRKDWDE